MTYLLLIIVTLVLGLGAQSWIRSTYRKWSQIPIATGLTGAEAARRMLDANGLQNVGIDMIDGELSDNFNPKDNTLHLSREVYGTSSVAATAVACHEAGHAIQHATGYTPIKVRASIVPIASVASNLWLILLIVGIALNSLNLVYVAIIMYGCVVAFQLATLPVEFNASNRALAVIDSSMFVPAEQKEGARKVLRSAAFTYVASALASLLQLLYFIGMARR